MAANESKIPVGTTLVGKYRVIREIGRGGMAAVYEAEQLSLGKKVAIKVLAAELAASTIVIERFFREARAAASVKSPHIVDVYDSGRLDDGRPFIAMEMLEGESLYDRMARIRLIDVPTTVQVIIHTAKGLVKAHAAGIVHRDLKPENIFLTRSDDGEDIIKILDFGLAKFYAPMNPEGPSQKRLTREGAVFGTPAYMSPEQVKGQGNVDHRADLWALGCMAYECLIGRPVWNMDQGVAMTFAAIATSPIPVPSHVRPDLPPEFDAWFAKCLQRNPDHRYQTAKELSDALVAVWEPQLRGSRASHPNVAFAGRSTPQLAGQAGYAGQAGQAGQVEELSVDVLESVRPPHGAPPPPSSQRGPGAAPPPPPDSNRYVSNGSVPIPLVQRASMDAATLQPDASPRRVSLARVALSATFLAVGVAAAAFVWVRFLNPQVRTPVLVSTATEVASGATSASPAGVPSTPEPKWVVVVSEAQKLFAQGDAPGALKKLEEASKIPGGGAVAKVFTEQLNITTKTPGPCKAVAFARPRLATERRAERPSIVATNGGAIVAWTDDHEDPGHDHVYAAMLDGTGKTVGSVRDLTPDAKEASRPQLAPLGADRSVLLYGDSTKPGKEFGVFARALDPQGRIDPTRGQRIPIHPPTKTALSWPAYERAPQGLYIVWQDDRDKEGDTDLFVRLLKDDLDLGPEMRLTDYVTAPRAKTAPRVRIPSVAVAANTLLVAYKLEKENNQREIVRVRVPLDKLVGTGLAMPKDAKDLKASRTLGDALTINDKGQTLVDGPDIACGQEGCFVAYQLDTGGTFAAFIDPKESKVIWTKKVGSEKATRPSLAVNAGRVAVTFFDQGRLKMSFLSRDTLVSPANVLFRVTDAAGPRASLTAGGQENEWYLAWQDAEAPRTEVYAARLVCNPTK
jgi:serine/threonine-protein kinase